MNDRYSEKSLTREEFKNDLSDEEAEPLVQPLLSGSQKRDIDFNVAEETEEQ